MIASPTDIRVRIAAVALAAMVALCALAAPTRAYAKLASEDDWQQNIDSREEGDPDGDSWDDYELGGEHRPGFDPLNPMPSITYTVYSWLEGMAGTLTNVSNDVWGALDSVGTLDSDYAPSADSPYRSIYNVATRVQRDVVNKVALGFLGIFLALSLLEFARETGTSPRYGIAQFSGFLWICAKFAVMIQLINHLDMLCGAIFNVFAWVARQTGSVISGLLPADAETFGGFMISMQKTTYSQAGVAFVYVLLALVIVKLRLLLFGTDHLDVDSDARNCDKRRTDNDIHRDIAAVLLRLAACRFVSGRGRFPFAFGNILFADRAILIDLAAFAFISAGTGLRG